MRKRYKIAAWAARIPMILCWHYKIENKKYLQNEDTTIIAANHISWFDPPFIGSITPYEIAYLAKAELFKKPILSFIIKQLNAIPIVRNMADIKGMNNIKKTIEDGKALLMFPQGTRYGKNIKPGIGMFAMQMKKDIIPIYLENTDKPIQCLFFIKRTKIVVGKPIKYTEFKDWEQNKENYQKLSNLVYEKIMELKK